MYEKIKNIDCISGKKRYFDLAKARKIARIINFKKEKFALKGVYFCKECFSYHLSSIVGENGSSIQKK